MSKLNTKIKCLYISACILLNTFYLNITNSITYSIFLNKLKKYYISKY